MENPQIKYLKFRQDINSMFLILGWVMLAVAGIVNTLLETEYFMLSLIIFWITFFLCLVNRITLDNEISELKLEEIRNRYGLPKY